jgi:hypothetical protein
MSVYTRSYIYNFNELPEEVQKNLLEEAGAGNSSDCYETTYVKDPCDKSQYLPLNMFMRIERSKLFDGIYSQSAFSAYFIKIGRTNEEATVAYRCN